MFFVPQKLSEFWN